MLNKTNFGSRFLVMAVDDRIAASKVPLLWRVKFLALNSGYGCMIRSSACADVNSFSKEARQSISLPHGSPPTSVKARSLAKVLAQDATRDLGQRGNGTCNSSRLSVGCPSTPPCRVGIDSIGSLSPTKAANPPGGMPRRVGLATIPIQAGNEPGQATFSSP